MTVEETVLLHFQEILKRLLYLVKCVIVMETLWMNEWMSDRLSLFRHVWTHREEATSKRNTYSQVHNVHRVSPRDELLLIHQSCELNAEASHTQTVQIWRRRPYYCRRPYNKKTILSWHAINNNNNTYIYLYSALSYSKRCYLIKTNDTILTRGMLKFEVKKQHEPHVVFPLQILAFLSLI